MKKIMKKMKKSFINKNINNNQSELKEDNESAAIETNTPDDSSSETESKKFGLCPKCNKPNTGYRWCQQCNAKRFQQDFPNWTSGNKYIDKFIQESQLSARILVTVIDRS